MVLYMIRGIIFGMVLLAALSIVLTTVQGDDWIVDDDPGTCSCACQISPCSRILTANCNAGWSTSTSCWCSYNSYTGSCTLVSSSCSCSP